MGGLWHYISFPFFTHMGPTEEALQDKFPPVTPKLRDCSQKDKICVKLSKYDIHIHTLGAIPVN